MPAITASASLSCGTALGETNDVTSMRGMPVAESRFTASIFRSVGMKSGSIWNPSRVPTSHTVTRLGNFMAFSSGSEGERASDRAYHQLLGQMHAHLDHGLESRAVLGDEVVHPEGPEGVHDLGDALPGQTGEVEAADDRVDPGNPGSGHGVSADAHDAAMRARRHHHQPAVSHVGDERLLADEAVLDDLAVALHLEGRRYDLEGLRVVHLAAQEHAFGQHGGRLDHAHVEIVALELVAIEAADVHPRVVALVVARQEMVAAAVE